MSDEDAKAVYQASNKTLAEWWCLLNNWEWPESGLGEPDPIPKPYRSDTRRRSLMTAIEHRIGLKECLREWNKKSLPGYRFDEWWNDFSTSMEKEQQA